MKLARYAVNGDIKIGRIDQAEKAIAPIPHVNDMFEAIERIDQIRAKTTDQQANPLADVTPVPGPHAFGTITGEDYASSRILQHDDWKPLSEQLHGALVVLMPAPDVLLYGDGSTDVGIQALRTYAVDVARKTDHPLPLVMLKWTERGWDVVE